MQLEIISRTPRTPGVPPGLDAPLLFVHGACCGAWVWDEYFLPYFAEQGYRAHALSLRGHGTSEQPDTLHLTGLDAYVEDLDEAVRQLGETPVLVGHSLGGVVVQKWLKRNAAPGAVLMGSGPPHGMLPSSLTMWFRNPGLVMQLALSQAFGPAAMSSHAARKLLFSEGLQVTKSNRHQARWSAESLRVGLELYLPRFPNRNRRQASGPAAHAHENPVPGTDARYTPTPTPTPMLVLGAEKDFFVSPTMVEATARVYGTRAHIIPNMAHAMMLEPRWQLAADHILAWLRQTPAPASP